MSNVAISVENLSKSYRIAHQANGARYKTLREDLMQMPKRILSRFQRFSSPLSSSDDFWALKDVNFSVQPGEVVGIIGRNGAGKSTLLKILSRITEPTSGEASVYGRVGSLLEVGTGFHQELTGRENIFLNGAILGMSRAEIRSRFDEIVAFAEIEKFLDTPVKRYSSGMYVRLAFAVAAHLDSEILIIDEVLAVGDTAFQKKCIDKMRDVSLTGRAVLFVSHNLSVVTSLCSGAMILDSGRVTASGCATDMVSSYLGKLRDSTTRSLLERTDREGSGRTRISEIQLIDERGTPIDHAFLGKPLRIKIAYTSQVIDVRPTVAISCFSEHGEKVFHVDNDMRGVELEKLTASGEYVCEITKLPLPAGTYHLNAMISTNGQIADHIYAAARLEVLPGDYFQTGRVTDAVGSLVLTDHSWSSHE